MRTTNRAKKARASGLPKKRTSVSRKGGKPIVDIGPAIQAVQKIRRDVFVSAERRRIPITV